MNDVPTVRPIIYGVSLVSGEDRHGEGERFRALSPITGASTGPEFFTAGDADVEQAVSAATAVFTRAGDEPPVPAMKLVADLLDAHAEVLVVQAMEETGLTRERLTGEVGRTSNQLRFMAELAERGERLDPTIDHGDLLAGRPDLRRIGMPIGPVAVFGASNFPFAFSVLGGDTAAALAAGCPVVVKAHESHPATSELCGRLMVQALADSGYEQGWFGLLQGRSPALGRVIVTASGVQAVAFTGSLQGGRALFDAASRRPDPIPVYAEMGSLNPVFVSAASAARCSEAIAEALAVSLTGSAGQLCTKPNLIVLPTGPEGEQLATALAEAFAGRPPRPLLNQRVHDAFVADVRDLSNMIDVQILSVQGGTGAVDDRTPGVDEAGPFAVPGTLFTVPVDELLSHVVLRTEHFGPTAVVVRCAENMYIRLARRLQGSLSATVYLEPDAAATWSELVQLLARKSGRVVVNGVPTGVAVVRAMHHGGPYPATTSGRDTSVGAAAIDRFLRPVCFQDLPDALLPPALRDANPRGIWRRIDGELTAPTPPADQLESLGCGVPRALDARLRDQPGVVERG